MDSTLWAALAGAGTAGLFTALGVWLTNRHAARERAADRHHELEVERYRATSRQHDERRTLVLPAMQLFSATGERLIRRLERAPHAVGVRASDSGVDEARTALEDSLVGLELVASEEVLRAAQTLVRMTRHQERDFSEGDRLAEWRALGVFRDLCRSDLFGDEPPAQSSQ